MSKKLVQFLIVSDGELQMTRDDTGLLVVTGGIASKFEDFSCEILEDSSKVNWSTSTDTLSVVALAQETVDTTDRECETCLGGSSRLCISMDHETEIQISKMKDASSESKTQVTYVKL